MEAENTLAPNEWISHGYVLWGKADSSTKVYTERNGRLERLIGVAEVDNRVLEGGRKVGWKAVHDPSMASLALCVK